MYGIQQQELFSFEQLMEFEPELKYASILNHLPVEKVLLAVNKRSQCGRPESLNTRAMIYSLVIGKIERMVFVKDIIRRLKSSAEFRVLCRFTGSDRVPSAASYSRLITKLHQCGVLSDVQEHMVLQSIDEGFISGDTLAVDSSHVEAWDRNPAAKREKDDSQKATSEQAALFAEKDYKPTPIEKPVRPKRDKPGPVPKKDREAWQKLMAEYKASLTIFERKVADMLPVPYEELLANMPQYPSTGAKGDPHRTGRTLYWYGYKANLLVDTQSQYIVAGLLSSAHLNDQRPAVVLLKHLKERFPHLNVGHILADKGYDSLPVYQQIVAMGALPLIQFIRHTEIPDGMDEYFHPICKAGHSYCYDSYDPRYKTIKFTCPKECSDCPVQAKGCQKVHKIRIETDLRRHTAPARGSEKYELLFNRRTAIERVFAYLKGYFGLGNTRLGKARMRVDFELSCLTYNLCKFALDKLNQQIRRVQAVA
jgi:transposase